jgi:hypothetical protein
MDDLLKKYLKQKGVKEVNELTEDDAFSFFYDRHGGFVRRCQGNLALMAIKEGRLTKSEVVKSMEQLEPDTLLELVSELPQDFMAIVVTQIDPMDFADQLVKYFGEVLSQVVMAQ